MIKKKDLSTRSPSSPSSQCKTCKEYNAFENRFIGHLMQEIDRLHAIITPLISSYVTEPKILYDPLKDLNTAKMDLFSEDRAQVQELYKEMGLSDKDINANT